ncbi:MAG TPA: hypothetical protein VGJ25_10030 [Gaiellaceae bacterium]
MAQGIRIVGQRQTSKVLDDGEVHSVVELAVIVDGQGPFVADVPADEWHPDNVIPIVRDIAWRARTIKGTIEQEQ